MIPGDEWSSEHGFILQEHDYFANREKHLDEYAERVRGKLEAYYAFESRVRVSLKTMEKFAADLRAITPWLLRRRMRNQKILISSKSGESVTHFAVDFFAAKVEEVPAEQTSSYEVRAEFPAIVLLQSIRMNMFSQAWISKRVHYHATRDKLLLLRAFLRIVELWEAEFLPVQSAISIRGLPALLPRWREGILYVQVLSHLLRGRGFLQIESRLLGGSAAKR
jgi:hypothetical protein